MDPYRELLATMAVIAAGAMLGRLAIRGVRLDMTAMLLVGALFAHFGVALSPSLGVFGLLLFLYTVGTQAGPSLRAMHRQDVHVAAASVAVLWILMAATYAIGGWIGLPTELRLGTMAGFFSSGASLALIQGRFGAEEGTAAGFALATPLCTLMVMILVQAWHARLQPRLGPELARWNEQMRRDSEPAMAARIRVTNPGAFGRTLAELKLPCTVLWILRANEHVPPRGDHHPNPPGRDRSASPGRLPLPLGRPGAGQRDRRDPPRRRPAGGRRAGGAQVLRIESGRDPPAARPPGPAFPPRGDHHPNPPGRDRSASPGRLPLPLGRPGAGQRWFASLATTRTTLNGRPFRGRRW